MKNRAFTLIELLVVVLIIGILVAIAVPQYQFAVAKSRYNTLKEMAHSIKNASDAYYLANGTYPTELKDLYISVPNGGWLKDGHCSIGGAAIWCNKTKLLGVQVEYGVSKRGKDRYCVAYSQNLDDAPNRFCQQETGTTNGNKEGTWTQYTYK